MNRMQDIFTWELCFLTIPGPLYAIQCYSLSSCPTAQRSLPHSVPCASVNYRLTRLSPEFLDPSQRWAPSLLRSVRNLAGGILGSSMITTRFGLSLPRGSGRGNKPGCSWRILSIWHMDWRLWAEILSVDCITLPAPWPHPKISAFVVVCLPKVPGRSQ